MGNLTKLEAFKRGFAMGVSTRPLILNEGGSPVPPPPPEPVDNHLYEGVVKLEATVKDTLDFREYVARADYIDSMYLLKQEASASSFTATIKTGRKYTYLIVFHRGSMSINSEFSLVAISPRIYVSEYDQAISIYRTDNIGEVQVNITHPSGKRFGIVCFSSDDEYILNEQDPTGSNNYSSTSYPTENGYRYLLASSAVYSSGVNVFTHSISKGSILNSVGTSERLLVTSFDSKASQASNIISKNNVGSYTINYVYLRKKV